MSGPWSDYASTPQAGPWQDYQQSPSTLQQLGAGAVEGVTGTLGSVVDALNPYNPIADEINRVSHLFGGKDVLQPSNTPHVLNRALGGVTGYNPENVPAPTSSDRIIRAVGAGLTGALIPGEEGFTVANMLRGGVTGAGAGLGAGVASEAAPDQLKPVAGVVGGLVGGLGAEGAMAGASRMAGAAKRVIDPYVAAASHTAAEAQAARQFVNQAKSPQTVQDLVSTETPEIVPGSQPTTAQLTGDTGLLAGERAQAVMRPQDYADVRATQNAARVGALRGMQTEADTMALPNALKTQFDAMDSDMAQHVADLTTQAQAKLKELDRPSRLRRTAN